MYNSSIKALLAIILDIFNIKILAVLAKAWV
jgi:hypothetical protein